MVTLWFQLVEALNQDSSAQVVQKDDMWEYGMWYLMGQLYGSTNTQAVNVVFREPVQQVLEKVKNESFFKWPKKMAGDPVNRN